VRVLLDVSAVPAQPVGAGVYIVELAKGLAGRNHVDLHLCARRNDHDRWEQLLPDATVHAVCPNRRPSRLAWEQYGAPALARALQPDVWHGPHYTLPIHIDVTGVVTIHDLTFFDHPEWHERTKVLYFRSMIRAAVARARAIVCISEFTAERQRARCNPRGEIIVVPHGVDHDRFAPRPERAAADDALLARHGINAPFVAFAGTIEPRKDVPTLVHAFARVADAHPKLRLVVAGGDGWGVEAARDAIATSGVATRVVRPGYLTDDALAALFRRAAVVAYPSREEGFGLPALEALASGTPLVSTTGSAIEEVVGDAALLTAPGDIDAFAASLTRALDDDALIARLRTTGPERAAGYTWARSVDGHIDAYRHAVLLPASA
jgi:glycosyltransferase involved in cell wall biosynthesis